MTLDFPKPTSITGGCLCGSIRYRVEFPPTHDFISACQTCQCTQCRRSTGSLFFPIHMVPESAFTFLTTPAAPAPPTLKSFRATPGAERCFCGDCGSFLLWRSDASDTIDLAVGCIDPEYLFGEEQREEVSDTTGREAGRQGNRRGRNEGFGRALAGAVTHMWCANEIAGVTDGMLRGRKMERDSEHGVVLYED